MATFVKYKGYQIPEEFIEPCMNCFTNVTYKRNEPKASTKAIGRDSIICPCCGKEMIVNYCNSILCTEVSEMKKSCENCTYSGKNCDCILCKKGNMVACKYKLRHVRKEDCCEKWKLQEKTMDISDVQKCQEEYKKILKESPLHGTIDKICKDILEQKNNAMAMEFTRIICDLLKRYGVHVHCTETKFSEKITHNSIEEKYGIVFDSMDFSQHDKEFKDEIAELKKQLERRQNTINQIDDILEKLFGVRHDVGKPNEFEKILADRAKGNVTDFFPTEPIKVADMLINSEGEYEHNPLVKKICGTDKGTYRIFDVSELRQIAEHLLVYCNHHGEMEE